MTENFKGGTIPGFIRGINGVDLTEVWNAVERNLPELKQQILTIFQAFQSSRHDN
jgi:uncharacterized protein with HEPN domain